VADQDELQELGRIVLLQIQVASLKAGVHPHRYYDPAPLRSVDRLLLEPAGCVGATASGERVVDVHHAQHPQTKNRRGLNGLSINFTSHYQAMRERFGMHLSDGIAGENILVESKDSLALDELGDAIFIRRAGGSTIRLADIVVATPCVEFSRFANFGGERLTSAELRSTLQFLDDGRRGFYASLAENAAEPVIEVGDRVYIARRG
jgi:hypothetical protein